MNISIYLGRFFGLYLLIVGVLAIVRGSSLRAIIHEMIKNPALIALSGAVSLILGLLLVLAHNKWEWNWHLVVTLLSYLILIQGIVRLFLPEYVKQIAHHFDHVQTIRITGFIGMILGIFLLICTFFSTQS